MSRLSENSVPLGIAVEGIEKLLTRKEEEK